VTLPQLFTQQILFLFLMNTGNANCSDVHKLSRNTCTSLNSCSHRTYWQQCTVNFVMPSCGQHRPTKHCAVTPVLAKPDDKTVKFVLSVRPSVSLCETPDSLNEVRTDIPVTATIGQQRRQLRTRDSPHIRSSEQSANTNCDRELR
jgi:hypothetical protein